MRALHSMLPERYQDLLSSLVPVHRYGPRVRMGIYEGLPTSVGPHTTSGRCDYWGPFVNRASRFANAAARGGQILVPAAVGRALVAALTKQDLPLEGGDLVLLAQPDFVPQKLKHRPSVPWGPQGAVHPLHMRTRRYEDSWLAPEVPVGPVVAGTCSACVLCACLLAAAARCPCHMQMTGRLACRGWIAGAAGSWRWLKAACLADRACTLGIQLCHHVCAPVMVTCWHVTCELCCRRAWAQVASGAPAHSLMAPLWRPILLDLSSAPSSTGTLQSMHAVDRTLASLYVGKSVPVYTHRWGMCLIQRVLVQCTGDAPLSSLATPCWPQRLSQTVAPGHSCPVSVS